MFANARVRLDARCDADLVASGKMGRLHILATGTSLMTRTGFDDLATFVYSSVLERGRMSPSAALLPFVGLAGADISDNDAPKKSCGIGTSFMGVISDTHLGSLAPDLAIYSHIESRPGNRIKLVSEAAN
jgi:hypothetical protein